MKQELEGIYQALAAGLLSKPEALRRIGALRGEGQASTLLASADWTPAPMHGVTGELVADEQRHVLLHRFASADAQAVASSIPAYACTTLPSTAGDDVGAAYTRLALAVFDTVQRLLVAKPRAPVLVQLVVAGDDETYWGSGLAGLFETARLEHPLLRGQIVFARAGARPDVIAQQIRDEWHVPGGTLAPLVRYTAEGRLTRRWQVVDECADEQSGTRVTTLLKERGVYLITGGLGGLGQLFARHILHHETGARVILAGRRLPDSARLPDLRAQGHVEFRTLDVTDFTQTTALVETIVHEHGQLNGIVHSAGLLRDSLIVKKQADAFADVLAPKVAGTVNLDRATRALDLDFMLLFSSIAAWAGNVGQADYAAANGFVEQFAGYRSALVAAGERRGRTLALAWPHWLDGGMHTDDGSRLALEQRTGLRSLRTETGMQAWYRAIALERAHLMVMHGEPAALRRGLEAPFVRPALQLLAQDEPRSENEGDRGDTGHTAATPDELRGKTCAFLRDELAPVLKLSAQRIDPHALLERYGIDSIVAMNLTTRLETTFGALPKTLFFEYRTLDELAGYFIESHARPLARRLVSSVVEPVVPTVPAEPATPTASPRAVGRRSRRRVPVPTVLTRATDEQERTHEPIAIVGLSGRYSQARDLDTYWRNLHEGRDCIVEIPRERWDWRDYYSADRTREGAHYSKWGGFIEGADEFDPRFFNIAPRDAAAIDPQERLFLQHAWMAIEDAGYTRASLQIPYAGRQPGQVGVYAGVMYGEYNVSNTLAGIANRVSSFLNLHGPSLTLDTMCSSSLTAIHLACEDLRSGRTSLALAGGVNLSIHPGKYAALSAGQFLSGDGHCQSFGEGGDGYIPGEGVGVAVLKRLADAERDGNHIYGVIRGSALNHGGKTNGYTVPNPQAQADVIRLAMEQAGVDPCHVSYIEAHGTGTKLGDPIEIAALTKAFNDGVAPAARRTGFCRIGSAKSNIGHCESAAGIAGVTKVLLQMKHRAIVPSLHSRRLNPHIDFDATPFVVNQTLAEWTPPSIDGGRCAPRIAGVSSFGAGGSNAHVIVEEYAAPERSSTWRDGPFIVPLSARTEQQLTHRVRDLLALLERDAAVDPLALAYTLQVGREAMDERVAFVVETPDALREQLHAFAHAVVTLPSGCWRSRVKTRDAYPFADANADAARQAEVERDVAARALPALARHWVEGWAIDWRRLYAPDRRPMLISLPTYPFAQERYWIDPVRAAQTLPMLHPLVHANTSDLYEQRYMSRFTGGEAFVEAGGADGRRYLPALLVLEQIRFALVSSVGGADGQGWEVGDLRWGDAIVADRGRAVHTVLLARDGGCIDVEIGSVDAQGGEFVHAQAHARAMGPQVPETVDLARLREGFAPYRGELPEGVARVWHGDGQWLAELAAVGGAASERARWALPPDLFKGVSAVFAVALGTPVVPMSVDRVCVTGECAGAATVWLRAGNGQAVDVDVCDALGHAFLQLRGLRWRVVEAVSLVENAVAAELLSADVVAADVVAVHSATDSTAQRAALRGKPADIVLPPLAGPAHVIAAAEAVPMTHPKAAVILADPETADAQADAESGPVSVLDLGDGVFRIDVRTADLASAVVPLARALEHVQGEAALKVLLLADASAHGWHGARATCNALVEQGVLAAMAAFACPLIVLAPFGAAGAGWLLSLVGDFMVLGDESSYGFTDAACGLFPSEAEDALFRARLGDVLADDALYCTGRLTGRQLRERGWTCRVASRADARADALQLARELAQKRLVATRLLVAHLRCEVAAAVAALVPVDAGIDAPDGAACTEEPCTEGDEAGRVASRLSQGVLIVELGTGRDAYDLVELNTELSEAFERAGTLPGCRSIVLTIGGAGEFADSVIGADDTAARTLLHTMLDCPLPILAAFEADAEGLAWALGLACDVSVYQRQAHYGVAGLEAWPWLVHAAASLGEVRVGPALNAQMCFAADPLSGDELRAHNGALAVVERADVLSHAMTLAACWRDWPAARVRAWKAARKARLRARLDRAAQAATFAASNEAVQAIEFTGTDPRPVPLRSTVVTTSAYPNGVLLVTMHDRDAKNQFTPALVDGLKEAFFHAEADLGCKVVVLTGFDSYFATGGTRDTLLAIQEGRARFTDEQVFQLPMECPVPVVAALQGHAIGAGWSFGMFADLAMLSEESHYVSPYMDYGFTPGAGSTLVFPQRIGLDLARETLLTASDSTGAALRTRGLALPVLPRNNVIAQALALAHRIARQPRVRLVRLKHQFRDAWRQARDQVYARELQMHEATFVSDADTLTRIEERFASGGAATNDLDRQAVAVSETPSANRAVVDTATNAATTAVTTTADEMLADIVATLRTLLARELHLQPEEIDESVPFVNVGLDSISGVTWVRKINERYGIGLEATRVYSHPTLLGIGAVVLQAAREAGTLRDTPPTHRSLAAVAAERGVSASPALATDARPAPTLASWRSRHTRIPRTGSRVSDAYVAAVNEPIAVIGMAGQFPKAHDVDAFWRNLAAGLDCVDEVPDARWRVRDYFQAGAPAPGKTYSRWLGALDAYDRFDPLFFNISPTEAECMDPQQRLFLQSAWHCIEHAGYSAQALAGSACGVFVGCGPGDYLQGADSVRLSAQGFTGTATSILAARVAYVLDLHGPCVSIDTACSSSLVALANACDSLNARHCDAALAGGVYVMGGPSMHVMTAQAGMLSPDGRCYAFDRRANGFVPGEAVGVLMLKRLADAERDGDRILAVLHGWGVNQDGKTNGITAPNENAQSQLLHSVYRRFGIDPNGIDLIEAHGTGTKLGDPIEVAGLKAAFKPFTQRVGYCALGSVKSNIGHCLTAAGAAGIIKLVQALRYRQLPPTLHYGECNEHIRLEDSPFYVNDRLVPWTVDAGRERRAAISSFGFSGTNAHIVLGEYAARDAARAPAVVLDRAGRMSVPLSARTKAQLRQKARDLVTFLRHAQAESDAPDLTELAYTLQVGRDAMEERAGFLVASTAELAERLEAYLSGDTLPEGVVEGQVRQHRDSIRLLSQDAEVRAALIAKWVEQRRLDKLLDLWTKGLDVDWAMLYDGDAKPRRIALPPYPFADERYWIRSEPAQPGDAAHGRDAMPAVTDTADATVLAIAAPVWDRVPDMQPMHPTQTAILDRPTRVLVLGASVADVPTLARRFPHAAFMDVDERTTVADLSAKLAPARFERLIWVVKAQGTPPGMTDESIVENQSCGLMLALRVAQALVDAGFEARALAWDWVTFGMIALQPADAADPTHAGLSGLCGSLADAYPRWALRLCDLPDVSDAAVGALDAPPASVKGDCYAWRDGEWFGQRLLEVRAPVADEYDALAHTPSPYRMHGVYVVIGGAGGIGEIWTRHVLAQCDANVVWIGRRPLDATLSARLGRIAIDANGRRPEYLQADAGDRSALEEAYRRIKGRYGAIHGVVHSAVGAFDQSLKTVSEADFRAILAAKIDVSVRLAQVFADEALDFALFFSSNASFVRGAGMAAYSAGCAFKDAFALQLNRVWRGAVKVVNWGYWNVGAGHAMSEAMKTYFDISGYRPIEPAQAMRALDALLAGPFRQWSIATLATGADARLASGDEWLDVVGDGASARARSSMLLPDLERLPAPAAFGALRGRAGQQMEPLLARLLSGMLAVTPSPAPSLARWLAESSKIVAAHAPTGMHLRSHPQAHDIATDLGAAWRAWDAALPAWLSDDGQRALVRLVDRCMRALPDVLRGARKATDVIFPDASLELVEQVYKTDAHSLAFNAGLCEALMATLQARIAAGPAVQLRLFEVGAGTGATSAGILERLRAYRDNVAEYCYTDVSKAFLLHAEGAYGRLAPFLRTQLFDVERPLEAQGIEAGRYDFVIAANVIHATANIRHALRNAKALLRPGGMLLMSEISCHSLCGHVTFGLLDGWWRHEDEALRMPGAPGLTPDTWRRVLGAEGFAPVLLPYRETHAAGQQIIVAVSDGIVRRQTAAPAVTSGSAPQSDRRPAVEHVASSPVVPGHRHASLHESAVQLCKQLIGKALKLDSRQIDAHEPLERYGIDSIVIGLVNRQLQQYFDDVGSTLLFEFQTVDALAAHLIATQRARLEALFGDPQPKPFEQATTTTTTTTATATATAYAPPLQVPAVTSRATPVTGRTSLGAPQPVSLGQRDGHARDPIAIVGISGLYPDAPDLDAFWRNLQAGRDSIREIPARRWPLDGFYEADERRAVDTGRSYCKWGGFVDAFAQFDCLFFGIPPREALNMDPQERLFMQAAWHALEHAGYTRATLRDDYGGRVGIFAGITRAGYNLHRPTAGDDARFRPRTSFASVANRLSYFLDVHGPSLPVDTMCSSSLTAIHEACEHIHNGDCDLALAGGVNLYLHPTSYLDMSSQHMLAPDGRCKSFGAGGNGFVPGEGAGVVLLKPLARAVNDGDTIHGVILATHVNHGGKTNGYTVPNPIAQAQLVRDAIDKAGISARDIGYIEAHGTGTELGDPIEIAGLQQAFARDTQETGFCSIGSVKSNIGHLEAAAGIAALTKVLLQLRHGQIAPSLHAATVNPNIRFERTPFRVSQGLSAWTPPVVDGVPRPRIAGISSFGAGGANAHVIVQEYRASHPPVARAHDGPVVVPLSARTAEQLRRKAADLLAHLRARRGEVDLAAVAYTLQTGREAMDERLGLIAQNADGLCAQLAAYADGERLADGAFRGGVQRAAAGGRIDARVEDDGMPEAIERWFAHGEQAKLLEQWVRGAAIDWRRLYGGGASARRVELPGYPFARDEYWLDALPPRQVTQVSASASARAATASADAPSDLGQVEVVLEQIDRAEIDVRDAARWIRSLM